MKADMSNEEFKRFLWNFDARDEYHLDLFYELYTYLKQANVLDKYM